MSNIFLSLKDFLLIRRKEFAFACIIAVVASFSFGIGYLAAKKAGVTPIIIEKCSRLP